MSTSTQKKVFVGLSGGVDSSVAALRLQQAGFAVTGVFIKVWHPDWMPCNWEAERLDAMRVAAHLNIPFLTCDAEAAYRDEVAKNFIAEYRAGRTPNPDVLCNQYVKFGAFLEYAEREGADFVATGHYVRKDREQLLRGIDTNKDQSYFLWSLSKDQLAKSLFPVGDTTKEAIRLEAERAGIPTAAKKDSQGICFLGHVDIPEFLSHYVDLTAGNVLDESGDVIGTHVGALVYTLGQRHGFTLHNTDSERTHMYVIDKNIVENTITVSSQKRVITHTTIKLHSVVLRSQINQGDTVEMQFRYRQSPIQCSVAAVREHKIELAPREEMEFPAAGQSCALYDAAICIGGGIIG